MDTTTNDIPDILLDSKSLSSLIIDLNIARRNSLAYPKGHPLIATSLTKVMEEYECLLGQNDEIILGVTGEALMINGVIMDKSNLVYRDFSRTLFEHEIGVLIFHHGLTIRELTNFTIILGLKREQIQQYGGIERVWEKAAIGAIAIRPLRYDLFQSPVENLPDDTTTGDNLWEKFARELSRNSFEAMTYEGGVFESQRTSQQLNRHFSTGRFSRSDIQELISELFIPTGIDPAAIRFSDIHFQQLGALISNLSPLLRRQFLEDCLDACGHLQQNAAERIIFNLTDAAVSSIVRDIDSQKLTPSPSIHALFTQRAKTIDSKYLLEVDDEFTSQIHIIMGEKSLEQFSPDVYQLLHRQTLETLLDVQPSKDTHSELLPFTESQAIDVSVRHILLNLVQEGIESADERELLFQTLSDTFTFALQTGDYLQLHSLIDQLLSDSIPPELKTRLRAEYGRREYLDEILDGLSIWGKARYDDIRSLILKLGDLFVDAVLDRLASEDSMSLRRFYIDCLVEMGPIAVNPVVNRLSDTRWYFLRNLLIILTALNDSSVVPLIRPLMKHENIKLRHDTLKTLVHFHDTQAEKMVLGYLGSQNSELQMTAINLSEQCIAPSIAEKLVELLMQGGYSQSECERKSAIVHSLGEIGNVDVLPHLFKILTSRSLINSRNLSKIKEDIVRTFTKYHSCTVVPELERIAAGSGNLARVATESLNMLVGKYP